MKVVYYCIVFCFLNFSVYGQYESTSERALNQIPASPSAASMLSFGHTPVNKFTGTPRVSIPIHDIQLGWFSFPIQLSYQARGVQVEEIAPSTGMSWNLSAGGVITRSIRGIPDEYPDGYSNGYAGAQVKKYVLDELSPSERRDFQYYMSDGLIDGQPDLYSYSFGPYQGEFFIAADTTVVQRYGDPLRVVLDKTYWPSITKFIVFDPDGVEYHFQDVEQTQQATVQTINGTTTPWDPLVYRSSWKLSKIVVPAHGEILFQYITETITPTYQDPVGIYVLRDAIVRDCDNEILTPSIFSSQLHNIINIEQKKLEKITYPSGEIAMIYQSSSRTDLAGDRALHQIAIKNQTGTLINTFEFTYTYFSSRLFLTQLSSYNATRPYQFFYDQAATLPTRTSKAQDYWGFYNGKTSNTTLIPKVNPASLAGFGLFEYAAGSNRDPDFSYMKRGILNRIKYPTGGETEFVYESHEFGNVLGYIPVADTTRLTSYRLDTLRADDSGWQELLFVLAFGQEVQISSTVSGPATQTQITDNLGNPIYGHLSTGSMIPQTHSQTTYLSAGTYKLRAFNYEVDFISRIQVGYLKQDSYTIAKQRKGGGLRIKEIMDYSAAGTLSSKKSYSYQLEGETDRSSGILISNYIHEYIQPVTGRQPIHCGLSSYQVNYYVRLSASATPLYSSHGSHIEYSQVRETRQAVGEPAGSMLTTYTSSKEPENRDFLMDTYPFVQQVSNQYRRGQIKLQQVFRGTTGSATKILEIENNYGTINPLPTDSLHYGTSVATEYKDPLLPITNIYIDNSYALRKDLYKRLSTTQRSYDGSTVHVQHTVFHYDNLLHQQPTRILTQQSDGTETVTFISYAQDYTNTSGFIQKMKEQHQLTLPIELLTYRQIGSSRTIIAGQISTYKNNNKGLLDITYQLESNGPINLTAFKFSSRNAAGIIPPAGSPAPYLPDSRYQPQLQYVNYDNYGNLLEIKPTHGPSTAYLWGYNGQHLIAQVNNATYSELQTLLGPTTINQLNAYAVTESFIRTTLQTVRTTRPQSLVQTFTYLPLVGPSSVTAPSGQILFYEYDDRRRLKWIKDHQNRIKNHYQYHLRP